MKKLLITISLTICILMSYNNTYAFDFSLPKLEGWTGKEVKKEIVIFTLRFIDYRQTTYIVEHPDEHYELNPILGRHPSKGRVNIFFLVGTVIHPLIVHYLPRERTKWYHVTKDFFQNTSIMIYGANDLRNWAVGLKVWF